MSQSRVCLGTEPTSNTTQDATENGRTSNKPSAMSTLSRNRIIELVEGIVTAEVATDAQLAELLPAANDEDLTRFASISNYYSLT